MSDFSLELWQIPLLFLVGIVASFLNSLSGGGSTISLPILIYMGIPPVFANGTNRVAVLAGNVGSVLSLRKGGFLERGIFRQIAVPVFVGAGMGAYFAVQMTDTVFRIVLACALVFVVIASNLKASVLTGAAKKGPFRAGWGAWFAFFGVGFYGGLIQVGVGFILIFVLTRFTGLDLLRVNALKGLVAMLFIATSTFVFVHAGLISWPAAIAQSAGGVLGGWMGGKFQIKRGENLIRRAIQLDAIFMAGRLLWDVLKD